MTDPYAPELFWLTLTLGLTALLWIPYILQLIAEQGVVRALVDPTGTHPLQAGWASRSKRAHYNAVENLAVFAPLVLLVVALGANGPATLTACMVYFFSRLAHVVIYTLGLPVVRTLVFVICWGCQMVLVAALLATLG